MENQVVQQQVSQSADSDFESGELQSSFSPPAFQLMASSFPIQRQVPGESEEAAPPSPIVTELTRLYAEEDKAPFWEYVHGHRSEIAADEAAGTWIDGNLSHIEDWRADTVVAEGGYTNWTDERKLELATWVRSQFPDVSVVQNFLQNEQITNDLKLYVLGKLKALVGQAEYLCGAIFHGGSNSWEADGSNQGQFVDDYHNETGFTWDHDAWCTMFAGYLHLMLGFREEIVTRDGAFWSNYRLDRWQTDGQRSNGDDATDSPGNYDDYSGATITHANFQGLYDSLVSHHDGTFDNDEAKETDLDGIFTSFHENHNIFPGDTIIINNAKGRDSAAKDHTVTVEAYSFSDHVISTVEGNSANRVRGRQIRMEEDPRTGSSTNVGNLFSLVRAGIEFYLPEQSEEQETEENQELSAFDTMVQTMIGLSEGLGLLTSMENVVTELRQMTQAESIVGAGTTVAEMSNPSNTAGSTN